MPENLYKRNGIYYARIQVAGREYRRSLKTASRSEAKRRLDMELSKISPYHGSVRMKAMDVIDAFLVSIEQTHKPKTRDRYLQSAVVLNNHFGERFWDTINKAAVMEYIAARKADGIKIATIRRDLTVLSGAAELAMDHDWGGTNPVTEIGKRVLRYKQPIFRLPSDASIEHCLSNLYGPMKPLCRLLLATGARRDEIVFLQWNQVNLERRAATLYDAKTGTRTISLNDEAVAILKAMPVNIHSPFVFLTRNNEPYKQLSTNWGERQRELKKNRPDFERFPLHGLRHIYAIRYLRAGGNLFTLQAQLGHESVRQTEWYLQYLTPEEAKSAREGSAQISAHPHRFSLAKGPNNG